MSSIVGNKIKMSIFGESHGECIGVVIDNMIPGFSIDEEKLKEFLSRRKPGGQLSTKRQEDDEFEIISGYFNGKTTGAPLCIVVKNNDKKSKDYEDIKHKARPSHSDFTNYIKFKGYNDYRGGGHSSGRLTLAMCICGGILLQILNKNGINIFSHISSIKGIKDRNIKDASSEELNNLAKKELAFFDENAKRKAIELIEKTRKEGDSIGGTIGTIIYGIDSGYGNPIFDGIESRISSLIFSIPAIKGIEFGNGFDSTLLFGSENNDGFYAQDKKILTKTNNSGGINGGITNGMPIYFNVAVKPTPSILKEQSTVNFKNLENDNIKVVGRHDPCIVVRAVPVVEAVTAFAIFDLLLGEGYEFRRY